MVRNPPPDYPRIAPYLLYEDVPAALAWLSEAFGFHERLRFEGEGGTVNHAEMELDDGLIMLGNPGAGYKSPKRSGGATVMVSVYVDDVDAHCERARAAGGTIVSEPADKPYGDRNYTVEDPEGHSWSFAQHVRDVAPTEWGATGSSPP